MPVSYLGIMIDYARNDHLTDQSKDLLKEKYCRPGEDIQEAFARACVAYGTDVDHSQRLYDYVSRNWFMFASPVLFNAPLPGEVAKGLPISCFSAFNPDHLEGLIDHAAEVSWLSVRGGGVGGHWSSVRAVSKKAPGPIPFMQTINSVVNAYRQGESRRGSYAAYLDVSHPDIMEFLQIRNPTGGDVNRKCLSVGFHHGVNITDKFMRAVENNWNWALIDPHTQEVRDTVRARELWEQIIEMRYKTGEPYLFFIDKANREMPKAQRMKGLRINGSNLCVAPETLVLTDKGHLPISTLKDQQVNVWNGSEWSEVTVRKTSDASELIRIILSNGRSVECTPEHKFYTKNAYHESPVKCMAKDLVIGDKLMKIPSLPVIPGHLSLDHAYANGFFSADGCHYEGTDILYFYGEKLNIAESVATSMGRPVYEDAGNNRMIIRSSDILLPKFMVPDASYTVDSRVEWFAGYIDGDGTLTDNSGTQSIQIASVQLGFLEKVSLMLQTLGIESKVTLAKDPGYYKLPDGKGGLSEFYCNAVHRLLIPEGGVQSLIELGILKYLKRVRPVKRTPKRESTHFTKVIGIEKTGRVSPTFCFTEPFRNMGVFNGILTGNCNEITLPTDENRTFVCCLSSLNAAMYDEWKDSRIVEDLLEMLDNVITAFIDLTDGLDGFKRSRFSAMQERAVGIGVLGLHSLFQQRDIAFGSTESRDLNRELFSLIRERADAHTLFLGAERGEAPDMEGTGRRNSCTMAVAPNANSGMIAGTSPSIEPWAANAFTSESRIGMYLIKNPAFEKVLQDHARGKSDPKWIDKQWKSIVEHNGSVQHLDYLSDHEKAVFRTAKEIDQMDIVTLGADRQAFIDQGQSLNLFFPKLADKERLSMVHYMAWKLGCKGLYYLRTEAIETAAPVGVRAQRKALQDHKEELQITVEPEHCEACEG